MFIITLVDIGGDGLTTEIESYLTTLIEVEILTIDTINLHLGVCCTRLEHIDDLIYSVWVNGHEAGVVSIKDANPVLKDSRGG